MKTKEKDLQSSIFAKLQKLDNTMNVRIALWYPTNECIDYVFALNGFKVQPNTNTICHFYSELQSDAFSTVEITLFCRGNGEYLQAKLNKRKEVNK